MLASAGALDGLVGFSFAAAQFADVTVTSFAQAADGSVIDVTAALTGAPAVLAQAGGVPSAYTIAGVVDASGQIAINQYATASGANTFVRALTYTVIGYSPGALLLATVSLASLVASVQAQRSVGGQIAVITARAAPNGTSFAFSPRGVFLGPIACFALGTRIRTTRGEVAVEDLGIGARVRGLVSGRLRRVRWIGRTTVALARHPRPWDVAPVRIRADALAPGKPGSDLLLSPDHAVLVGGALIPVRYLMNGATIRQEWADKITYLHVELDAHDVLLAEGLPCESFLDTGNRGAFAPAAAALRPWRPPAPMIGTAHPPQHGEPP